MRAIGQNLVGDNANYRKADPAIQVQCRTPRNNGMCDARDMWGWTVGSGHQRGEVDLEMRGSCQRRFVKESESVHPTMSRRKSV
jgi:hypothetical protein